MVSGKGKGSGKEREGKVEQSRSFRRRLQLAPAAVCTGRADKATWLVLSPPEEELERRASAHSSGRTTTSSASAESVGHRVWSTQTSSVYCLFV